MSLKDDVAKATITIDDAKKMSDNEMSAHFQDGAFAYTCNQVGMNNVEYEAAKKFIYEEHAACRQKIKPCAGYSYGFKLSLTPCNIGTGVEVTCTICKQTKDVTDVGGW